MKTSRPVYLNLWRIRFPLPAIISILHRISGVIIFIGIPLFLYLLSLSLKSSKSFQNLTQNILPNPITKGILWIFVSALLFHFFAGVRHIIMDAGVGESLKGGRLLAALVVLCSAVAIILVGVWIW